ncbi:unnamed protein product [Prorocentrum cordatum]|uniref:RRM domain-containing protein n=1 Tax=Prorocentrum cordatum TaxID=2364126 RepID=A0ABN9R4I7_9DINO|nr:unnamed protein product [Polarella glacialis]
MKADLNSYNVSSRGSASQGTEQAGGGKGGGGGKEETQKELRRRQVVAFGFDGNTPAPTVVNELKEKLSNIIGNDPTTIVKTTTDPAKFGIIEFSTLQAKVNFWKKVRDKLNSDEEAFGDILFQNNSTKVATSMTTERARAISRWDPERDAQTQTQRRVGRPKTRWWDDVL